LKSSITVASLVGLGFHPPPGRPKTLSFLFVCLSVCLFVTLWNVRVCAPCFAMKALEYRNNFDAVGSGKVCSRAPVLNFLTLMPTGDTTEYQSPKTVKKMGGVAGRGRQNKPISRRNFARKRTSWVYFNALNLALIGKRGSVQESRKCQNLSKIVVFGHRKLTQ